MIKNDIYETTIEDIGNDGEGIGHVCDKQNGMRMAVFVKDTVIGDVVKVRIIKVKKTYAYGRLEEIIAPSSFRTKPLCSKARSCGGCSLMHMTYEKQLDYKWNKVKSCLERIGKLENAADIMEAPHGMSRPFYYRNKMQLPVGRDKASNIVIGFYAGRTHSIIDLNECHIGHPVNEYIIKATRKWLTQNEQLVKKEFGCDIVYYEETNKGLVRHILTRVGFATGELMVCLVINGNRLSQALAKGYEEMLKEELKAYNAIGGDGLSIHLASLSININKEKTNKILGNKCITLSGNDYIEDYIGDVKFKISPLSFYQVNPVQTKAIYDKAIEFADLKGGEVVWDMYCGIGTISLSMTKKARKVYGVEIVPQAIADAKENAKLNKIENAEFFCGKAEEVVPDFYKNNSEAEGKHPDVIVVDPPRKGCDSVLLSTISEMNPDRLVYVSCDPATLARDIDILRGYGFEAKKVAIYDAFCQSTHVESVVLITRKEK